MDTNEPLLSQQPGTRLLSEYPASSSAASPPPSYTPEANPYNNNTSPSAAAGGYTAPSLAPYPAPQPQYGGGEGYYPYQPPTTQDPHVIPAIAVVKGSVVREYFLLSAVISASALLFCSPWILLCSLPALLLSLSSRDSAQEGNTEAAKKKALVALICDIVAILSYILQIILLPVVIVVCLMGNDC